MGGFTIRAAAWADAPAILALHQAVAAIPGGIARRPHEVTPAYVERVMAEAADGGLNLVAVEAGGEIFGEIHAMRMKLDLFAHVLTDLTVAVHPAWQGMGMGSGLFEALIAAARELTPAVGRIELWTGAGNLGAQKLYQRLGFKIEGRMVGRGRLPDGRVDDDIVMGLLL